MEHIDNNSESYNNAEQISSGNVGGFSGDFIVCGKKITIRAVNPTSGPSISATFRKLSYTSDYVDTELKYLIPKINEATSLTPDIAIPALIKIITGWVLPKPVNFAGVTITAPIVGTNNHKILLDTFADYSYGTKELARTQEHNPTEADLNAIIIMCLYGLRLASYRGENSSMKTLTKQKLYDLTNSLGSSLQVIEKLKSSDTYYVKVMGNEVISYLGAVVDAVCICCDTWHLKSLRLCTITLYHKDSGTLVKLHQVLNAKNIDQEFVILSAITPGLGREMSILCSSGTQAFMDKSPLTYMRACSWSSKSAFSASEMPHLHTYFGTILGIMTGNSLFRSMFFSGECEEDITLGYLVTQAQKGSGAIGRYVKTQNSGGVTLNAADQKVENREEKINQLIERFKITHKLLPEELEALKSFSCQHKDKKETIAYFIDKMTPATPEECKKIRKLLHGGSDDFTEPDHTGGLSYETLSKTVDYL